MALRGASFARFSDGRLGEVFLDAECESPIAEAARESALLASLALQHGCPSKPYGMRSAGATSARWQLPWQRLRDLRSADTSLPKLGRVSREGDEKCRAAARFPNRNAFHKPRRAPASFCCGPSNAAISIETTEEIALLDNRVTRNRIGSLIQKGYLSPEMHNDLKAIRNAFHCFLDGR